MSKILGITFGGHDTAAALTADGELVAACAQERFTLDKHSRRFPKEAALECLRLGGVGIEDIDEVAYVGDLPSKIRELYLRPALESDAHLASMFDNIEKMTRIWNIPGAIRENLKYGGEIKLYRHHTCHAASAYFASGFDEALCVSNDGVGEYESGAMVRGAGGAVEPIRADNAYPHSLGLLYSAVTAYLGWKHHYDEGIVMGLAPFGDGDAEVPGAKMTYNEVFREAVTETGDYAYEINSKWIDYYTARDKWVTDLFIEMCGPRRAPEGPIEQRHMNIAAALQNRLEEVVLAQLRRARAEFGYSKLCLAGGVSLNCSLNGKIERSKIFDEIFVQPASGDDGCAVGACFLAHSARNGPAPVRRQRDFYKGSRFTDDEIKAAVRSSGAAFTESEDVCAAAAACLAEGKIVAWFQGGAEFGPRALGNRSILCRPYPASMKDHLNARVKFREAFRPFAPAVLREHQSDYFDIGQDSPHMLIACKVRADKKDEIPAVVHVDDTCRVQTVSEETNALFYGLLSAFHKITDVPVLLNTSFNVKGQPIVNTPEQAVETFLSTNIDVLVMGRHIAVKS